MADAALNNPDGIVRQVLFPIVSENTLNALVKEFKNTGSHYKQKIYTVMRVLNVNEKFALARITAAAPTHSVSSPPSPCCRSEAVLAR